MGYKRKTTKIGATTGMEGRPKTVDRTRAFAGKDMNTSPRSTANANKSANKYAPKVTKGGRVSQGGDRGGISAGHSRVRKGKNTVGAGRPQAMRG